MNGENISKKIIISGSTPIMITFDEVYQKYQNLLRKKVHSWSNTYEYEELYQVASIALWKAYKNYDLSKYPIPFGTLAIKYIDNALLNYHSQNKPKFNRQTSQIKSLVSIHDIVFDDKYDGIELEELIGEAETFTHETADRLLLEKLLNKFSKQQQEDIWNYVAAGYKLKEIAKSKDVSKQATSMRMQNTFSKFRALYIKEMAK